jgi:histidine ammonia-lyase
VTVVLGADPLTAEQLIAVASGARVRIGPAARTRMTVTRSLVTAALERGDAVYGLTRRLGAGAGQAVTDQAAFQRQVIRNHLGATGEPLPGVLVRAAMAARLAHLAAGGAGARPEVADALAALLNSGVVPLVRERGSVGAADLALNAAVAAVLVGEGEVLPGGDGSPVEAAEALRAAGLTPLTLEAHEALSLINTNAFAYGSAALLALRLETLAEAADRAVALSIEAAALHRASGNLGPFAAVVHQDFEGEGQAASAALVRELLAGSFLTDEGRERAVQDELCFRCAPQVHGAVAEAAESVLLDLDRDLAARPENPLVDAESGTITANGNFAPVGLALDLEKARLAVAHLAAVSERRVAVLSGLAAPLRAADRAGIPGLLAYTAAEGLAAVRHLAQPVTLGGGPLSVVEDYATYAWPAADAGHRASDRALEIVAIEALHAASLVRAVEAPRLGAGTAPLFDRLIGVIERGRDADRLVSDAMTVLAS